MDKPDPTRSKNMRAIRGKNTKLEECVAKALWQRGVRFRRNVGDLYGKPDIAIKKYKIVIFVDSCFWHFCSDHTTIPKRNRDFWINKLSRNKERDQEVTEYYRERGWYVFRIWEHRLKEDFDGVIDELVECVQNTKRVEFLNI
ncbi:T/G mismatch-specific endonuclease [Laceyella sediminis]|jgi:DNA mismatch endonuclease, patch repair protein|uniref:Very short patch repair endonuclease n=1 Tax=Laceyella sediminis TaxID=573074 RepID=A0ABX5EUE8_9BACL|nr:very short patch repair endonuclease [Laceyella sediminis]PRZ15945.1 T/G mismatch-specific endonuclease [Laceyella sediminis]